MPNNKVEEYQQRVAELQQQKKVLADELAKDFPNLFMELFSTYPEVNNFSWTQFTPYFNDGDTCEFYSHTDAGSIYLNGEDPYDNPQADWKAATEKRDPFANILQSLGDDLLKEMFGDHVRVTVYRDRVEVEDYEHD